MNKNILFLPLISCALLTSCAGEDANKTIEPPKQAEGRSITFEVEPLGVETKSTSTKVSVRPADASDGLEWTNNEEVSFLFYESEENQFESTFTVKKDMLGNVSMTGSRPATAGNYHVIAMSPKGDYFKDASFESTLSIPQTQTQTGSTYGHLTDYVYLYSHPATKLAVDASGNTSGEFPLLFNPLNSLVRFDIVNESTTKVTLNSITIKFSGGGVLYTSATVQEGLGTLEYSGEVSDMTLGLSNASINGGVATPFVAYMAAWSSKASGTLEIQLNITPDGESTRTLIYDLDNVLFEEGLRTHIELNIAAGDVGYVFEAGLGEETVESLSYRTYTYIPPHGKPITWMMTNYAYNTANDGYRAYSTSCPADWSIPSTSHINDLFAHFSSYPGLAALFRDSQTGPDRYVSSYGASFRPDPDNLNCLYFTTNVVSNWVSGAANGRRVDGGVYNYVTNAPVSVSISITNTKIGIPAYDNSYIYPVRCVKLI
jgi:hypothetical protein